MLTEKSVACAGTTWRGAGVSPDPSANAALPVSASDVPSTSRAIIVRIVVPPFFQDFVKSLCFEYNPPKRTTLSTTLLNAEAANITLKIEEELHQSKNLTLG